MAKWWEALEIPNAESTVAPETANRDTDALLPAATPDGAVGQGDPTSTSKARSGAPSKTSKTPKATQPPSGDHSHVSKSQSARAFRKDAPTKAPSAAPAQSQKKATKTPATPQARLQATAARTPSATTKSTSPYGSSVDHGMMKFRPNFTFGGPPELRKKYMLAPPSKKAPAVPSADTWVPDYKRRSIPRGPPGIGMAQPSVLRNPSRRAHALTRDVHRAPPRAAQSYPIPAPIGHISSDASRTSFQRRKSPAKLHEERAKVIQTRRDKASRKQTEIDDRRAASSGVAEDKEQATTAQAGREGPEEEKVQAIPTGRQEDSWDPEEDQPLMLWAQRTNTGNQHTASQSQAINAPENSEENNLVTIANRTLSITGTSAPRNEGRGPQPSCDSDSDDAAAFRAARARASRRRRRQSSGNFEEARAILREAGERGAIRRTEMELPQLRPQPNFVPNFQIPTRPIPRTKEVAKPKKQKAVDNNSDNTAQPAPSVQPAATTDASMEDNPMLDAPMDSDPGPVAQPEIVEDTQMEGEVQTLTQATTVSETTPHPAMSVTAAVETVQHPTMPAPAVFENPMDNAAPLLYDITTYARFPNDAPGSNPVGGWPVNNVAHPPAHFRDIQYPGLPETIRPFSRDQTAHIRAIIPPHVRELVETPPNPAPLTLSGANRTGRRQRIEPD